MGASNLSTSNVLGDPRLWKELAHTVRRRLDRVEVDDVVQSTLTEALAAKALPTADEEVRRFVFAIARQKIADHYRRRERDRRRAQAECMSVEAAPSNDVRSWIERTLPRSPSAKQTFDWMVREAEGETFAEIAVVDGVSAPMVRQRVSRLRRWLQGRWAKDLAALTSLVLVATGIAFAILREQTASSVDPDRGIRPEETAPRTAPTELTPLETEPRPATLTPAESSGPRRRPVVSLPPPGRSPPTGVSPPQLTAGLVTTKRWERSANGEENTVTTFNVTLPRIDVRSCVLPSSPPGVSHISVSFRPDGSVEAALVDGGVTVGRTEARCVERLFSSVHTRPFTGGPAVGDAYFSLVREAPPSWLRPD